MLFFSQTHYAFLHFNAFAHNAFLKYFARKLNFFKQIRHNFSVNITHFREFDYYLRLFFKNFTLILFKFCYYLNKNQLRFFDKKIIHKKEKWFRENYSRNHPAYALTDLYFLFFIIIDF